MGKKYVTSHKAAGNLRQRRGLPAALPAAL